MMLCFVRYKTDNILAIKKPFTKICEGLFFIHKTQIIMKKSTLKHKAKAQNFATFSNKTQDIIYC